MVKQAQILTGNKVHVRESVHVGEQRPTHTHTHMHVVRRMEGTSGAGISFPQFKRKTPCKQSQLSGPKLI